MLNRENHLSNEVANQKPWGNWMEIGRQGTMVQLLGSTPFVENNMVWSLNWVNIPLSAVSPSFSWHWLNHSKSHVFFRYDAVGKVLAAP
jgi:hypothetical protein